MNWKAAMADQPASVRAVAAFWTNHAPSTPMTVVTSASVSRLSQLRAQCNSWSGPLSAMLYQPLPSPHPSAVNQAALRAAVLEVCVAPSLPAPITTIPASGQASGIHARSVCVCVCVCVDRRAVAGYSAS